MNKVQIAHLNKVLEDVARESTEKYVKGAIEHESVLSEDFSILQLNEFKWEEVLDLTNYGHTEREHARRIMKLLNFIENKYTCKKCGKGE